MGVCQLAVTPGKAENLRNVNGSSHGCVLVGGAIGSDTW